MKNILLILLFLSSYTATSQINNGTISYKTINNISSFKDTDPSLKNILLEMSKESQKINFTLNFSGKESYFYANPILLENTSYESQAGLLGGKLKYYQNNLTNEYREFIDSENLGKLIVNKKPNYSWTLNNDTIQIEGFKCYKAISPIYTDGEINTNVKFVITAWYCPEIPANYGPSGYGDLPGLILELQLPLASFVATKIQLNLNPTPIIDKLDNIKAIELFEYKKRMKESISKEKLKTIEQRN